MLSFFAFTYCFPLQGKWVDSTLSQSLSRKCDQVVRVKNAKIVRWFRVSFGAVDVHSKNGKLLIRAGSGQIRLKRFGLRKDVPREVEIRLQDVAFFKDYYRHTFSFGPLNLLMRKPITVSRLNARVAEKGSRMDIGVLGSSAKEITLSGEMTIEKNRVVQNTISVSLYTSKILRAIF